MIRIAYEPRSDSRSIAYAVAGDRIIATVDGVSEEYDFAQVGNGELLVIENSVLPIAVLLGARRVDGDLYVTLLRAIPPRPTDPGEISAWKALWTDLEEIVDDEAGEPPAQAHKATLLWKAQGEIDSEREAKAWAALRRERDRLLAASDWTQLPDVPMDPELRQSWQIYRQALRDVPEQPGAPWDVTWPEPPVSEG